MSITLITIMLAWFSTGLLGMILDDKFTVVNWFMFFFVVFVPFIPWVSHWCGLF